VISIILPTLNRADQLVRNLRILRENSRTTLEIVVILDKEDTESKYKLLAYFNEEVKEYFIVKIMEGHPSPVEKWNEGAKLSSGEWLMLGADDVEWTPAWDDISLKTFPNKGFLALRDFADSKKVFEPHFMATRQWLKMYNGGVLAIPHYKHWYLDLEIALRAGKHYEVSQAVLPHKHVIWGTAPNDKTYKRAKPYYEIDSQIFDDRRKRGFPNDFESYL